MTAEAPRCGVTGELTDTVVLVGAAGQTTPSVEVYVCAREPGHGGTVHVGPPLVPPRDGSEHTARWPIGAPAQAPRPPRERDHDRHHGLDTATGPYRVGRDCPWNVYRQLTGDGATKDDPSLFDAGTGALAELVVRALNFHRQIRESLARFPGTSVSFTVVDDAEINSDGGVPLDAIPIAGFYAIPDADGALTARQLDDLRIAAEVGYDVKLSSRTLRALLDRLNQTARDRDTHAVAAHEWEERAGWASGVLVGLRSWAKEMRTLATSVGPQQILDRLPADERTERAASGQTP